MAFVKVLHVLNSFSITYPRTPLESRYALQPHKPCKYGVPETLGLKLLYIVCPQGGSTSPCPTPVLPATNVLQACRWEDCARRRPHYVSPLPAPPDTAITGMGRVHLPFRAESLLLLTPRLAGCVGWPGLVSGPTGLITTLVGSWLAGAPGSWGAQRVGVVLLGRWSCRNAGPARGEGARQQSPSALCPWRHTRGSPLWRRSWT